MTLYGELISRERGGGYQTMSRPEDIEKAAAEPDHSPFHANSEVLFWLRRGLCLDSALIMAGLKRSSHAGCPLVRGG